MQKEVLQPIHEQVFFTESEINLDDLMQTCSQKTLKEEYPLADSVENNVVIYDARNITPLIDNSNQEKRVKTELNHILEKGPGVFAIRNLYEEKVIDESNVIFDKIKIRVTLFLTRLLKMKLLIKTIISLLVAIQGYGTAFKRLPSKTLKPLSVIMLTTS